MKLGGAALVAPLFPVPAFAKESYETELEKCRDDVVYFAKSCLDIDLTDWQIVQIKNMEKYESYYRFTTLTGMGTSTSLLIYTLHKSVFNDGFISIIVSPMNMIQLRDASTYWKLYNRLPNWMFDENLHSINMHYTDSIRSEVHLRNGSLTTFQTAYSVANIGYQRGMSVDLLVFNNIELTKPRSVSQSVFASLVPMIANTSQRIDVV